MKISVDKTKCVGCRVCEIVCTANRYKVFNPKLSRIRVPITFPTPSSAKVCQQCVNAKCIEACVFDALYKGDHEVVLMDDSKCTGCGACVSACPFKVMFIHVITERPIKCDLCSGSSPACVEYCPVQAISME